MVGHRVGHGLHHGLGNVLAHVQSFLLEMSAIHTTVMFLWLRVI